MSAPTVLRATGLTKQYSSGGESVPVLRGIDLDVGRGECVYLAGPSGSGKTTLLSILGCVLSPDAGRLEILGQDIRQLDSQGLAHFRRDRLGFVFQRFHLFNALTALENVCVPQQLQGRTDTGARQRARVLLERVGLGAHLHRRSTHLSMGQRQRVAFARALANDPELILADEPTASLDAEAGAGAMQLLKQLCVELGKSVIVVTHDSRIFHLADRVLRLADGRIVDDDRAKTSAAPVPLRARTSERQAVV